MTIDAELQRHRRNWIGFTKFLKFGTATVVLVLVLLALFVA
jgi:Bacterial aa3 type cytochrome c oxidase subunit IV